MKIELTTDLSLELRKRFNSHARLTFWSVWLYDDATGLSLQVGEAYYSSKHKAEAGFEEALGFFRRTLPIKKEAA